MQSFGERLRHERETRNTTIEEIAAATGIHRGFLEALETNDFQSLPGRAFGKFYLRAYAEILDFDPEPLIVHYDRERRREPPEAYERPPDEPTLRKVEASLARWRAERLSRHGGRESVGIAEPEVAQDVEVVGAADLEVAQDVDAAAGQLTLESDGGRESVGIAEPEVAEDIEVVGAADPDVAQDIEVAAEQLTLESHGGREIVGADAEVVAPVEFEEVAATTDVVEAAAEDVPTDTHTEDVRLDADYKPITVNEIRARRFRLPHILAATVGVVVVGLIVVLLRPSSTSTPAPAVSAPTTAATSVPEPVPTSPPVVTPPKPKAAPVRTRPSPPPTSTNLTVSDIGLGRQEGSRIVPGGEKFAAGNVVAFSTRVIGGSAGQSIRHVWIHRGRAVQSIRLRVGAADWRTHSTKTLWAEGPWSVEARDEAGRVLAQASFVCEKAAR
jgi:transcriptional regulator with XRE-family HTH domain